MYNDDKLRITMPISKNYCYVPTQGGNEEER